MHELALQLGQSPHAAFLGGLLHDFGRPIVLRASIDTLAHRSKEPLPDALLETAMDEFHAAVGARLVEAWNLAEPIAAAVEHHHDPAKAAAHEKAARLTQLADALSHRARDEYPKHLSIPVSPATKMRPPRPT